RIACILFGEGVVVICRGLRGVARRAVVFGLWGLGFRLDVQTSVCYTAFMMIAAEPAVDVQSLEQRIRERNTRMQADAAEQARDLALFDELEGWAGLGLACA